MAQRVESVDNPRYTLPGLTTTSGSIVSTRAVMVPPTTAQGVFKGSGDYSSGGNQYIQFQIADNECFMDNKCLFFIADLLVYGPNNSEVNGNGTTYGNPLDLYFDQSTDALFSQVTIGSPQGLKMEEIQQYNMWANIIRLHTETAAHKEHELLRYSEYHKDKGKSYGLQHLSDDLWRSPCRIPVGVKTRIAVRLQHCDVLQNMDLFPLFLMRNGLQITLYLENIYKAMYCPSGFSTARDIVLHSSVVDPSYLINVGRLNSAAAAIALTVTADANTFLSGQIVNYSPYFSLSSFFTGANVLVNSQTSLTIPYGIYNSLLNQCGECKPGPDRNQFWACPVSIKEWNQVVWSGFALMNVSTLNLRGASVIRDGAVSDDNSLNAHAMTVMTVTSEAKTNTEIAAYVSGARSNVKQLDTDGSVPYIPLSAANITAYTLSRFPSGADYGLTAASSRDLAVNVHLFSFNDQEQIPFARLDTAADILACNRQHFHSGGEVIFHCADAVRLDTVGAANGAVAGGAAGASTDAAMADPNVDSAAFRISDP